MTSYTCILLACLLSGNLSLAQLPFTKDQKAAQETVLQLFSALSARDSVALKSACANDIKLYEYGQTWTLDSLILKAIILNTAADFKRVNIIDFIDTRVHDNIAWTSYNNQADIIANGMHRVIYWQETVILMKENDAWKVKLLHSSMISRK
jgi:hypothetical protein